MILDYINKNGNSVLRGEEE